jgi:adenylate cyclase
VALARSMAAHAIILDDSNAGAYALLAALDLFDRKYDAAVANGRRAVDLQPNFGPGYHWLGEALITSGKPAEGIDWEEKGMRLDPRNFEYLTDLGWGLVVMGRYVDSIPVLNRRLIDFPNDVFAHLFLIISYTELGRLTEARKEADEVLRLSPQFSVEVTRRQSPLRDRSLVERYCADYRKAGLK